MYCLNPKRSGVGVTGVILASGVLVAVGNGVRVPSGALVAVAVTVGAAGGVIVLKDGMVGV